MDGSVELMLHRRLLHDDGRGVGEALNDSTIVTPKLWLIVDADIETSNRLHRRLSNVLQFPLLPVFASFTPQNWNTIYTTNYSAINETELPENIHVLTFENRQLQGQIRTILRLIHIYEVEEHDKLSLNVTVNLDRLFPKLKIISWNETTLTLHTVITSDAKKDITLSPMQIRSFTIEFVPDPHGDNKFDPTVLIIVITSVLAILILGTVLGYYNKRSKGAHAEHQRLINEEQ